MLTFLGQEMLSSIVAILFRDFPVRSAFFTLCRILNCFPLAYVLGVLALVDHKHWNFLV